jgi:hypothetical protein
MLYNISMGVLSDSTVTGNKFVTLVKSGHRGRKGTLLHSMLLMHRPGQHK